MSRDDADGHGQRGGEGRDWLGERGRQLSRLHVLVLPALLVLAAVLRLPDLATRGTWDGDQGHDMLILHALVRDGVIPLLGPPTSIGDVHHGAWYYYLLSPAAAVTGGDSPLDHATNRCLMYIWFDSEYILSALRHFASPLFMAQSRKRATIRYK